MKVKRYIGESTQDAMQKVRVDLGKDAVILHTRKIRQKGIIGFFAKPFIEIVAAIDDSPVTLSSAAKEQEASSAFTPLVIESKKDIKLENLDNKMTIMSDMINHLLNEIKKDTPPKPLYSTDVQKKVDQLMQNEVHPDLANMLGKRAQDALDKYGGDLTAIMTELIKDCLHSSQPSKMQEKNKKIVIFLGPTGVGKTTTLAKMAAIYSIQNNDHVGLITADTYRIAAVEQLKTYAEILRVPLYIIYSPREIKEALKYHEDKEIIFIDTAGKSPKDKLLEKEIKELLLLCKPSQVYLVVSATTAYHGIVNLVNCYRFIDDFELIITKIDETTSYGNILNIALITGKPIAYLTTGQNVPDDIEEANIEKIANHLIG